MASIHDDDELLLARIGYKQVLTVLGNSSPLIVLSTNVSRN